MACEADLLAIIKRDMELDCERLRTNIEDLMKDRTVIREEFLHLNDLQRNLMVQLKSDTLAGEGQLHTFQVEKKRLEERLLQLEEQLMDKNRALLDLDAKASEYLLKVTTASNTMYDGDENSEEIEADRDLIKQLVYNDMVEHNDFTDLPNNENVDRSPSPNRTESSVSASTSEKISRSASGSEEDSKLKSYSRDSSGTYDDASLSADKSNLMSEAQVEDLPLEETVQDPATYEQVAALSNLLDELRKVKEEMGSFVNVKDSSMNELEYELQNTKSELAALKDSMQNLVKELKVGEESEPATPKPKERSLSNISELQEIKDICSVIQVEKEDLVHKMGSLKDTMQEIQRDRSRSVEGSGNFPFGELTVPTVRSSLGRRSSSTCSISGRVALLEKELDLSHDRLNESAMHMKLLLREREHKQRECELLQRKVTKVESKMGELQVSFDTLMTSIMMERDELVKELDEKKTAAESDRNLATNNKELKVEIENLKVHLLQREEEFLSKINTVQQEKSHLERERNELKTKVTEMETLKPVDEQAFPELKEQLDAKEHQVKKLQERVYNFEMERADFATVLKAEIERIKEESDKMKEDKMNAEAALASFQTDHKELQSSHEKLKVDIDSLQKETNEKAQSLESLITEIAEQKQLNNSLQMNNEKIVQERDESEKELKEELNAREATIQELNVTLTNNQKQSRENYQMIQDDMAVLQIRLTKEREEYDAMVSHLKDKCVKLEVDAQQLQQERDSLKNKLEDKEKMEQQSESQVQEIVETHEKQVHEAEMQEFEEIKKQDKQVEEKNKINEKLEGQVEDPVTKADDKETLQAKQESQGNQEKHEQTEEELKEKENKFRTILADREKELQAILADREARIRELEEKVTYLEEEIKKTMDKMKEKPTTEEGDDEEVIIVCHRGTLTDNLDEQERTKESEEVVKSRMEEQLRLIENLNNNLDDIKKELSSVTTEKDGFRQRVEKLELEKEAVEKENVSLQEGLNEKLNQIQDLEADAEVKKNLVEKLDLKLSSIENRVLDKPFSVDSSLLVRLEVLETFYETKFRKYSDDFQCKINLLERELQILRSEKESCEFNTAKPLLEQIEELKRKNLVLIEENKKVVSDSEKQHDKAIEMQDQMVSDLEKLILSLEADKKELLKEVDTFKSELHLLKEERGRTLADLESRRHCIKKEREILLEKIKIYETPDSDCNNDVEALSYEVKELQEKLIEVKANAKNNELLFEEKLKQNADAHLAEMKQLRRDMTEEIDILEQQKEELRNEHENELSRIASEYASKLLQSEHEHNLLLSEEKAQFGRVLVSKNDDYEKLEEERRIEALGYQARLHDLQIQLDEKTNLADELETNICELVTVRSNLEEKLQSFMPQRSEPSSPEPSATPGLSNVPPPLLSTNVKPPMQS